MFNHLKRLYDAGALTIESLQSAVEKEWITPAQYEGICGETYTI